MYPLSFPNRQRDHILRFGNLITLAACGLMTPARALKVVFSAIVGDARKKIGGNVFTKVRSGAMVRRKVSPIQPRSVAQRGVRANFTALSKSWSTITDAQRAAWNALSAQAPRKDKFGASHILTGLQLYQSLNRNLATLGVAAISTPPPTLSAGYPAALTVVATVAGPNTLTVLPATFNAATDGWAIYAGAQVSPGRSNVNGKYRLIKEGITVLAAATDISPAYVAKFGALIATKKVPILMVYINQTTGAKGTPTSALQVVT